MATNAFVNIAADNSRLQRSRTMTNPSAATYNLIRLPRFAFIKNVWLNITTAFTSGSMTVGYVGNSGSDVANYFMDEAQADALDDGMRMADIALYLEDGSGYLTVTVSGSGAGVFMVFVDYAVIH